MNFLRWVRQNPKAFIPDREDWLDQADGVLIVLAYVAAYLLGYRGGAFLGLVLLALVLLHLRMMDRKIARQRNAMLNESIKLLSDSRAVIQVVSGRAMRKPAEPRVN